LQQQKAEKMKANLIATKKAQLARIGLVENNHERVKEQVEALRVVASTQGVVQQVSIELGERVRVEDIAELAQHFLQTFSKKYHRPCPSISEDALTRMKQYHWPGNIRELSHLMERLLFTCKEEFVQAQDLRLTLNEANETPNENTIQHAINQPSSTLEEIEKQVLVCRAQHFQGNATETTKSLGLSRSGYYRRLAKYELD